VRTDARGEFAVEVPETTLFVASEREEWVVQQAEIPARATDVVLWLVDPDAQEQDDEIEWSGR
jgi:hypothetical protein